MRVRLLKERDTTDGRKPAGHIIDHPDGEYLVKLGIAEEAPEEDPPASSEKTPEDASTAAPEKTAEDAVPAPPAETTKVPDK